MQTPKILYFTQLAFSDVSMARIKKIGELVEISSLDEVSDSDLETINIAFAPLSFRFGSHFFDRAPNLRVIASNTTGVPHIELVAAATRNISVCALHNQQDFLEQITPTAEHTQTHKHSLTRRQIHTHTHTHTPYHTTHTHSYIIPHMI